MYTLIRIYIYILYDSWNRAFRHRDLPPTPDNIKVYKKRYDDGEPLAATLAPSVGNGGGGDVNVLMGAMMRLKVCCRVLLHCVVVCENVWRCAAVCFGGCCRVLLQYVAVCCNAVQSDAVGGVECTHGGYDAAQDVLQCVVAVRSSVLQCVTVCFNVWWECCCSMLQCVAVVCSEWFRMYSWGQ